MDLNLTVWRKQKNRIIQIRLIYFDVKPTLNVSSDNFHQDIDITRIVFNSDGCLFVLFCFVFSTLFILSDLLPYCLFGKTNTKYTLGRHLTWMTSRRSVNIKTYLFLHISLKTGGFFWSLKKPSFSNIIPRAKNVLNTFKLRVLNVRLWIFRYIHFLYSCYLDKHPSWCEQFSWYQSPDEGYKTDMFNVGFTSKSINLIWIILGFFFCFLHTVRFRSIFTSIYIYIYNQLI